MPRLSDVDHAREALAFVREPPLVNQERRVDLPLVQSAEDALVGLDGNEHRLELGQEQTEHEVRCRPLAGDRDALALQRRERGRSFGDHHGAVAAPHRAPCGNKR